MDGSAKTGIGNRALKPTLGVIDPINMETMPKQVAIASGFDVLCHSLESYTAIPYNQRSPRPLNPNLRPAYQGSNPISDVWCQQSLKVCAVSLCAQSVCVRSQFVRKQFVCSLQNRACETSHRHNAVPYILLFIKMHVLSSLLDVANEFYRRCWPTIFWPRSTPTTPLQRNRCVWLPHMQEWALVTQVSTYATACPIQSQG